MPWTPGDDVIEVVQRAPQPGGAGGAYRAFGETLRGLKTTLRAHRRGPDDDPVPRGEGRRSTRASAAATSCTASRTPGLEKCVGCSLCAAACPADCIRVVAAENTPENRVSAGERYAAVYEINLSRCIFCGYCEVACPFDAITMGHDYEMSDYNRSDLIFTKEMLLAEPLERTPLRARGRVASAPRMAAVLFFIAAIGAIAGAIGVVALRNPFYSVLALVCHLLSLAALFLLLRARVRRRRAGHRLRRRGDGALRVRRRLRRRRRTSRSRRRRGGPGAARVVDRCSRGALFVELCDRDARLRPEGASTPRAPPYGAGFGTPGADRQLLLTKFLLAVRGRLVPAAGRRRRRGRARAPPRRPRRRDDEPRQRDRRSCARRAPARWPRRRRPTGAPAPAERGRAAERREDGGGW